MQHLSAGEYKLAVFAHAANSPEWKVEKQVAIPDDKVSEVMILLDSKPKSATTPITRPTIPR